jgi:hypothetical protein
VPDTGQGNLLIADNVGDSKEARNGWSNLLIADDVGVSKEARNGWSLPTAVWRGMAYALYKIASYCSALATPLIAK